MSGDDGALIAKLSNEFATVWLELDEEDANGPRLRIRDMRDEQEIYLDPVAIALLCQLDRNVLALLADIARDGPARDEFARWLESRHEPLVLPEGLTTPPPGAAAEDES